MPKMGVRSVAELVQLAARVGVASSPQRVFCCTYSGSALGSCQRKANDRLPPRGSQAHTWYYGVRCECKRLLALCEDCFHGKADDAVLPVPIPLTVQCPCGVANNAQILRKFKTL